MKSYFLEVNDAPEIHQLTCLLFTGTSASLLDKHSLILVSFIEALVSSVKSSVCWLELITGRVIGDIREVGTQSLGGGK